MSLLVADDQELLIRDHSMGFRHRAAIVAEIIGLYLKVRWMMIRHDLPVVVDQLRDGVADRYPDEQARRIGWRLGQPVLRTLSPLPWDSRCLMRSLVLVRMLARRGVKAQLVIGVRPGGEFSAHAWVEHSGRPLTPPRRHERLTTI